jgi:hypothetical protein
MGDENVPSHVNLGNRVWNNRVPNFYPLSFLLK